MAGDYDDEQLRGGREAYRRYLEGMNSSMKQKVALTAAHLLCEGRVADMGMGSGAGSFALAALYPGLDVVGVDVSPTMVELATESHRLPNLGFRVGDIAQPVFDDASLDGIFDFGGLEILGVGMRNAEIHTDGPSGDFLTFDVDIVNR